MVLPTFPHSPMYAEMTRQKAWNENSNVYDSGDVQGFTNWIRPLYRYDLKITAMTDTKQQSLWAFWDTVRATTDPWLMKDPYDNYVASVIVANSGVLQATTLFIFDTRSYMIRPDTTTVGSLFSTISGYVTAGSEYSIDRDSGVMTVNTKVNTDVWRANSMSYWKKAKFSSQMIENDPMWNIFSVDKLSVMELP